MSCEDLPTPECRVDIHYICRGWKIIDGPNGQRLRKGCPCPCHEAAVAVSDSAVNGQPPTAEREAIWPDKGST